VRMAPYLLCDLGVRRSISPIGTGTTLATRVLWKPLAVCNTPWRRVAPIEARLPKVRRLFHYVIHLLSPCRSCLSHAAPAAMRGFAAGGLAGLLVALRPDQPRSARSPLVATSPKIPHPPARRRSGVTELRSHAWLGRCSPSRGRHAGVVSWPAGRLGGGGQRAGACTAGRMA